MRYNHTQWDEYFFLLAIAAASRSKDPNTQHGAVIADKNNIVVGIGYNGLIRGIEDTDRIWNDRAKKDGFVIHAEQNALDNSFKSVKGCDLYLYSSKGYYPCPHCAKEIAHRGIKNVFVMATPEPHDKYDWTLTEEIFFESGVYMNRIKYTKDFLIGRL